MRTFPAWLSDVDPNTWEQARAQAKVQQRFAHAFGPTTVAEVRDWSGWQNQDMLAYSSPRLYIDGAPGD